MNTEYPNHLLVSVAESALRKPNKPSGTCEHNNENREKKKKEKKYRKWAMRYKRVWHLLLLENSRICKATDLFVKAHQGFVKKHRSPFVPCVQGMVYHILFSYGKVYIRQTTRCLNDGLGEHKQKLSISEWTHISALW